MKKPIVAAFVAGWMMWGGATLCLAGSDLNQDFRQWAAVYLNFPIAGPVKGYLEANP